MEGAAGVQKSLSLPSLHGTSPRKKAAGRGSGKQRTRAGMLRSQSVEPRSAELSALALLCEAKLKESREAARRAGYPDRSTYDAPATRRCFDLGNKVPKWVTKDYPGYKVPSHYSCSVETNAKLEQQSVSSGRRTPPSADRLFSNSGDGDFVSGSQSSVNRYTS